MWPARWTPAHHHGHIPRRVARMWSISFALLATVRVKSRRFPGSLIINQAIGLFGGRRGDGEPERSAKRSRASLDQVQCRVRNGFGQRCREVTGSAVNIHSFGRVKDEVGASWRRRKLSRVGKNLPRKLLQESEFVNYAMRRSNWQSIRVIASRWSGWYSELLIA